MIRLIALGRALLLLAFCLSANIASADDQPWALCGAGQPATPLPDLGSPTDPSLHLSADHVQSTKGGNAQFSGNVVVLRAGKRLEAQQGLYDKKDNTVDLSGDVKIYTRNLTASGEHAHLNADNDSGTLSNAHYEVRGAHASGSAASVVITDPKHIALQDATYTKCDPNKVDWLLKAHQITLNEATNTGVARDVVLRFKGVPLFYLPYMNFPLQGRKSGFLAPTFGSSNKTGTDVSIPYYWNIAPNYDATFAPRQMSARGTMLETEFRYLEPADSGQLNLDYLPKDKADANKSRLHIDYGNNANLSDGWTSSLAYRYVSDPNYFLDLGVNQPNNQINTSVTALERHLSLSKQGAGWGFQAMVQGYQTLSGDEPYSRMPQLKFSTSTAPRLDAPRFALNSELVDFASSNPLVPTGTRVDVKPTLSLPLAGPAWFFKPSVAVRYTAYQLKNNATSNSLTRTLPITSLDAGLYFDRNMTLGGHSLVQTLEPRLYYLYVPYRDQSNLPVFDTAAYDFTFAQLFRDNRFSGADRQGDARQVTMALTSRLDDANNGTELLRASIGQIHYLSDRLVTLPGQTMVETQHSDLVAELGSRPTQSLDLAVSTRWNPNTKKTEVLNYGAHYHPDADRLLGFDYRYRSDLNLRQADLMAYWPISRHWRVLGRWNYDIDNQRSLDGVEGFSYEACCWALNITTQQHYDIPTQHTDHSIYLSLELKGLTTLGRRLREYLPVQQ